MKSTKSITDESCATSASSSNGVHGEYGDDMLVAQVERSLRSNGHLPLRCLQIVAHGGFVSLRGTVPSYYLKQLAQEKALSVHGIERVVNDLVVAPPITRRSPKKLADYLQR